MGDRLRFLQLERERAAAMAAANAKPDKVQPVSRLESGVRGAAQGLTLDFADELAGVGGALSDTLLGDTALSQLGSAYRKNRDESRSLYKAAQKANPGTYLAGQVGGGAATMAVPFLNVAKGANLARAASVGARAGGLGGLGSSEADLTDPTLGNVARAGLSTAGGAALGGLTGGALHTVFNPSKAAKDIAIKATKEHLRASPRVAANLGEEGLSGAAEESLKQGAIKPFSKAGTTAENLDKIIERLGKEKGAAVDELVSSGAAVKTTDAVSSLQSAVKDIDTTSVAEPAVARLQRFVNKFEKRYKDMEVIPLNVMEKEKTAFQNAAKTAYKANQPTEMQQGLMGLASKARVLGETAAEQSQNKAALEKFLASKKSLSKLYPAEEMAERTGSLTSGGFMPHITDVGVGSAALSQAFHGNLWPLLAIPARGITKGRVASTIAAGADAASNMTSGLPSSARIPAHLTRGLQQPGAWSYLLNGE